MSEHYFEVDGITYIRPRMGEPNYYQTSPMVELKEDHHEVCECERESASWVAWDGQHECNYSDGRTEEQLLYRHLDLEL